MLPFQSATKRFPRPLIRRFSSEKTPPKPPSGKVEAEPKKAVRVSVLGGDTPTGESTAFLLKQNPLISHLFIYGGGRVNAIAADLRHLDTRCKITACHGQDGLPNAIRSADIILLVGSHDESIPAKGTAKELLESEGPRVVELAEQCSRYAPRALLTVCVSPIAITLPLVAAVFRRGSWYHPGRIIGSVAWIQILANSLVARFQDQDPASVHVPLVGGPDLDCIVPLFSRAEPLGLSGKDADMLTRRLKGLEDADSTYTMTDLCKAIDSPLSEAFGINRMVTTMALGMCGHSEAVYSAFIRSNAVDTCRHLVSAVRFGSNRVVHNYGIPRLTKLEMDLFHEATLLLKKRDREAYDFLSGADAKAGANLMSQRAARA